MNGQRFDTLQKASSAFRASALGRSTWEDALSCFTDTLGGVFSTFELIDKKTGQVFEFHASSGPEISQEYLLHYMPLNPRIKHGMMPGASAVQFDQKFISEPEMDGNEFYSDFLRPFDLRYFLGYKAFETPDVVGAFTLQRSSSCGSIDVEELESVENLGQVMSIAAESYFNYGKLLKASRYLETAVNGITEGVVFLTPAGRVLEMNDVAQRIMRQSDGIEMHRGHLACTAPQTNIQFFQMIENLADPSRLETAARTIVVKRPSGLPAFTIRLLCDPDVSSTTIAAGNPDTLIVFIHDPCQDKARDAELLCDAFGFTPAEARVAIALEAGQTADEYARSNGISLPTVRTQLQRVMQKLHVNRQVDVVRVLSEFWSTAR